MKRLVKLLPVFALVMALMPAQGASVIAAAPPGPYFNGFEKNTNGWFGVAGSTITRTASVAGSSYANGIQSSSGNWHARLGVGSDTRCDNGTPTGLPQFPGPFTDWGGSSSTFPTGGYKTSVDIYLDAVWARQLTHQDQRFDWSSAISDTSGNPRRDFVFNVGTDPLGFVITGGNNANRCGADPYSVDPSHAPRVSITQSGWYTFQHSFTATASGVLTVTMTLTQKSTGTVEGTWVRSDPSDVVGVTVGGDAYGWFVQNEIDQLAIDNSLRTGLCHSHDGDGDEKGKDSGNAHFHSHAQSCDGQESQGQGDVEESDPGSNTNFKSTSITSQTFTADEASQTLTMVGTGTDNGLPVAFTLVAVDNGLAGPGVYTLVLSDGYAVTGTLIDGTLTIN